MTGLSLQPTSEISALWLPGWHGLGQTIVAGGGGDFFFTRDTNQRLLFWDWLVADMSTAFVAQATIKSIRHSVFGQVRGVVVHSLDLVVVLESSSTITVDAEQEPGWMQSRNETLKDFGFMVELIDFRETGQGVSEYVDRRTEAELLDEERRWAALLGHERYPLPYEHDVSPV